MKHKLSLSINQISGKILISTTFSLFSCLHTSSRFNPPTPCPSTSKIKLPPILNKTLPPPPPTLSNKPWNNNYTVHLNERNQNKNKNKSFHIQIDVLLLHLACKQGEDVHLIFLPHIFTVRIFYGACYIMGQLGRVQNNIKLT